MGGGGALGVRFKGLWGLEVKGSRCCLFFWCWGGWGGREGFGSLLWQGLWGGVGGGAVGLRFLMTGSSFICCMLCFAFCLFCCFDAWFVLLCLLVMFACVLFV